MNELPPHNPFIEGPNNQELKVQLISLAKDLSKQPEGFPFPGIGEETLEQLRAVDEEDPGYTTPVDEIIEKMEKEGIKIVLGEDPESGNVFVLAQSSKDVGLESLLPRHLDTIPEMDESLRLLILIQKAIFESEQK